MPEQGNPRPNLRWSTIAAGLAVTLVLAMPVFWSGAAGAGQEEPQAAQADATPAPTWTEFELSDYRGRMYRFNQDFGSQRILVLAFLGTECPLAKLYGPRLAELAARYEQQGVAFVGIMSNAQDSVTEMAAYARRHDIKFPLLKDLENRLADQLGAQRTPEVFVLDEGRQVRYAGRVDDQYGVGYIRDEPTAKELDNALQDLLAGRDVRLPRTEPVGCLIGRVRQADPAATVTYSRQVSRILQKHCVECHRPGEIGPFALTDYQEVAGWGEMIAEVVDEGRMPPWHADPAHGKFRNENRLSEVDKQVLRDWVAAGAPEGNPAELPEPRQYVTGWQLPREPDQIISVSPQPYNVPATGEVRYQYFVVDPGFTEDKWIEAAELLPGNRAVVHHILSFARTGRNDPQEGGVQGFLVGYVPGLRVEPFPQGMAKRVPAGAKLVFQVHYTPVGSAQTDQSQLGLVFADPKKITHEVVTTSAVQRSLRIPPNAEHHRVEATRRPLDDALLLGLMPHMHLRGSAFRYEAWLPDGSKEVLLDIPHYDFNWQTSYRLAEPRPLPAGTRMHCVAHFDNSERNLNNPDPSQTVGWGDQTWDEMMIGYFDIAVPVSDPAKPAPENTTAKTRAEELMERLDKNQDGVLSKAETPALLQRSFARVDADQDERVTLDELIKAFEQR